MSVGCSSVTGDEGPAPLSFGVLGSTCSPDRVAALRDAGVSVVELPVAWDRYQPRAEQVDRSYVARIHTQLATCRDAGLSVVLSPGLQYPPDWVKALPGGVLAGSSGGTPQNSGAELIFSAKVRKAARKYLARIASDIGFDGIVAIRAGTNDSGELGYPGPEDGGNEREFWAFGDAPQLGIGLVEGESPSPMQGWVPGSKTWKGKTVTEEQVRRWWNWYAGSAVNAVVWQVQQLRSLGFQGRVHVPVAGRGVSPSEETEAVKGHLDGRANPDGAQERGLNYSSQFAVLATLPGVDIDFTGLDDVSAVRARAEVPSQDQCHPDDPEAMVHEDTSTWSFHRYISALARRLGLGLVGENPGPPDAPFTGGSPDSDSLAAQLRLAPKYAADCGMTMFLFGFEKDLFEKAGPTGSRVTLGDYKEVIRHL